MSRTSGLPRPGPNPTRLEGKRHAQRARCDAGVTYEQIAKATGRSMQLVYDAMNVNDDRRHLSYADLIAMSRHSHTKTFVAHLLEPIEQNVRPKPEPKK